jgi:hypothetical protein
LRRANADARIVCSTVGVGFTLGTGVFGADVAAGAPPVMPTPSDVAGLSSEPPQAVRRIMVTDARKSLERALAFIGVPSLQSNSDP